MQQGFVLWLHLLAASDKILSQHGVTLYPGGNFTSVLFESLFCVPN